MNTDVVCEGHDLCSCAMHREMRTSLGVEPMETDVPNWPENIQREERKLTPDAINAAVNKLPVAARHEVATIDKKAQGIELWSKIERLKQDIVEYSTIDVGVYYDNKIDALAALAKILKDDKLTNEVKRAKLVNYRRLGQMAETLRPTRHPGKRLTAILTTKDKKERRLKKQAGQPVLERPRGGVSERGAVSLLREHGMTAGKATTVLRVSRVPDQVLQSALTAEKVPTPAALGSQYGRGRGRTGGQKLSSDSWLAFYSDRTGGTNAGHFRSFVKRKSAKDLARGMRPDEVVKCREIVKELTDWLDEFDQYLPKEPAT